MAARCRIIVCDNLLVNIFIWFGTKSYVQIVGLPMYKLCHKLYKHCLCFIAVILYVTFVVKHFYKKVCRNLNFMATKFKFRKTVGIRDLKGLSLAAKR